MNEGSKLALGKAGFGPQIPQQHRYSNIATRMLGLGGHVRQLGRFFS